MTREEEKMVRRLIVAVRSGEQLELDTATLALEYHLGIRRLAESGAAGEGA